MTFVRALALADMWDDDMTGLVLAGQPVLLVKLDGAVHAYEDRCAHLGVRVSGGLLRDGVVACPAHFWTYDGRTGAGVNPTDACLVGYAAEVRGGDVWVDVP